MFTGIVEEMGVLTDRVVRGESARLTVEMKAAPLTLGESIAVEGVCLTVQSLTGRGFVADCSSETMARTNLGKLTPGTRVNLERALAVGGRLGGHFVSGHVDGVGILRSRVEETGSTKMTFEAPDELLRFIAEKGSITVNGTSLTVNAVSQNTFSVMLIPHTLRETTMQRLQVSDSVNLEIDMLARYVARLHDISEAKTSLLRTLQEKGYT